MYDPEEMPAPRPRIAGDWRDGLVQRSVDSARHSPALTPVAVAAMRANYAGSVTLIDDQVGEILDVLRRRGEYDNTLVIFASDHGELNGDHGFVYKSNFLDPSVRVPLVVRPPGGAQEPRRSSALVELMDVAATIAEAAEPGAALGHARPLQDVLAGDERHRDAVHAEYAGYTMHLEEAWKAEVTPEGDVSLLVDVAVDPLESTSLVTAATRDVQERILVEVERFVAATPPPERAVVLGESAA
jgi:choline-sulfatase